VVSQQIPLFELQGDQHTGGDDCGEQECPCVIVGVDQNAIRNPDIVGCRTTRYSHGVRNESGV
jgi:hypothetical protein